MKKITRIVLLALGFSLLVVGLGFLTSRPAPAQATSTPVTVVNGPATPVPTSPVGTTTVTGRVTAVQGGPPYLVRAVQATIPWRVSNGPMPSSIVTLVSTGASCAQQDYAFYQLQNGSLTLTEFSPPAGQVLVVTDVNFSPITASACIQSGTPNQNFCHVVFFPFTPGVPSPYTVYELCGLADGQGDLRGIREHLSTGFIFPTGGRSLIGGLVLRGYLTTNQ